MGIALAIVSSCHRCSKNECIPWTVLPATLSRGVTTQLHLSQQIMSFKVEFMTLGCSILWNDGNIKCRTIYRKVIIYRADIYSGCNNNARPPAAYYLQVGKIVGSVLRH